MKNHRLKMQQYSKKKLILTFILTWVTQFLVYSLRKPIGLLKIHVESEFAVSKTELGLLDISFLLPYSLVQICGAGYLDRVFSSPTVLISICLSTASVSMCLSGFVDSIVSYCFWLAICGLAQGPIWPACAKLMSHACPPKKRASVLGFLSTALFTGAFVSTAFASYILEVIEWRYFYVITLAPCLCTAALVMTCLRNDENSVSIEGSSIHEECQSSTTNGNTQSKASFYEIWSIKTVPEITISLFFLKFVRYALYLWLPLYLNESLGYTSFRSGLLSTLFDIGGVAGGPIIGFLSDRYGKTLSWICKACLYSSLAFMILAMFSDQGVVILGSCLFIIGVCNCGCDSILTGPVSTQLGEMDGKGLEAGVTSLINGLSSVGGIVEGPILGVISSYFGWNAVLVLQIALSFLAGITIYKAHTETK